MGYNKHYITLNADNYIIDTHSDAFGQPPTIYTWICINEKGGYQFRFYPGGEENPSLRDDDGNFIYQYINGEIIRVNV
jgi:hypothetical protein